MESDKKKILVVDDDPNNMHAIVGCFKDKYDILYANDGRKGYDLAMKALPDIVIMDWSMPVMNGLDATLMLKSTASTQDIPIIMATGVMTTTGDLKNALEAGAIDFIRKPFDELELASRTKAALRLSYYHQQNQQLMAKEQQLLQAQLAHRERELALQAIQINEKNQFLNEVSHAVESLQTYVSAEGTGTLTQIKKRLLEHTDTERGWSNFVVHFEKVHPRFFSGLKVDFPALTNNELRLSAYIKIGMANKEMAQLMGISLTTIKSNVNRLKKKLGLGADHSIRSFLINYQGNTPE